MRQDDKAAVAPNPLAARRAGLGFALDVWHAPDGAAVLRRELAAPSDNRRQRALLNYELGRIALAEGDETAAAQYLLQAYTLRPQFRPTIRLARLMYHQRRDYPLVAKLLAAEARATRDPIVRASLQRRRAHLIWCQLDLLAETLEALGEAQRLDPTDLATLKLAEIIHCVEEDPVARRQAIHRQLEVVSDRALQTALLVDLGLSLADEDLPAANEAFAAADETGVATASLLIASEQFYESSGQHGLLVETLLRQAAAPGRAPNCRRAFGLGLRAFSATISETAAERRRCSRNRSNATPNSTSPSTATSC